MPERKITMNATSALPDIKNAQRREPLVRLKRILAPVDFSENSEKALHYVRTFAGRFDADLVLLHVVEPTIIPDNFGMIPPAYEQVGQALVKTAEERLARMAHDLSSVAGEVRCLVQVGRAAWEIVRVAEEVKADLIVITTHGYTGLKHVLMGSTAELIVRHAPCAVMTVPLRGGGPA